MPNWTIPDQSREAQLARIADRLNAIMDRGAEEARHPHNPVLRAAVEKREAERRAEYEALHCDGMHEALKACEHDRANKRRPWASRMAAE